jgi:hypothetical protein
MCRIKPFIMCMAVVFLIACAGQPVRNTASLTNKDCKTTQEEVAKQWDAKSQSTETFYERNRQIMTDALIFALVVTEICLFWYLADKHYDKNEPFLWIGPIWPLWY